jgi:hypothetical protein
MNQSSNDSEILIPDLILNGPPPASRTIDGVGGGRGMRAMLPVLAERERESPGSKIRLFEPRVSKGRELVRLAAERGVTMQLRTARGEDGLRGGTDGGLVLIHTDDPATTASLLANDRLAHRPILAQLLLRYSDRIAGIRIAAPGGDQATRHAGVVLFERLAELRARRGAAAIVDDPAFSVIEEPVRAWMRSAVEREAERLEVGIEPESDPIELTLDGIETAPVFVVETNAPEAPDAVVRRTLATELEHRTLTRGTSFMVAEVPRHERALYLHEARLRLTDGALRVLGREALTSESFNRAAIMGTSSTLNDLGLLLAFFAITAAAPVVTTD